MIDLTLNSIMIPDIDGYTNPYHFGTKIIRTLANKGGLSTREVNNNIISAFGKMRVITIADTDSTSNVEFDAKLFINAEQSITLTLGNATYSGCVVTIFNNTEFSHTLVCQSINPSAATLQPYEQIELTWNGTCWQNSLAPSVGKVVVQYPQELQPSLIYPCTSWTEIENLSGSFFRSYKNGVSGNFIQENESIVVQNSKTALNGLSFNGIQDESTNENSAPSFNWVNQYGIGHSHGINLHTQRTYSGGTVWNSTDIESTQSWSSAAPTFYTDYRNIVLNGSTSGSHTHDITTDGTISSTDNETRPANLTIKLWKRTA